MTEKIVLKRRLMGCLCSYPLDKKPIDSAFSKLMFKAHGYKFTLVTKKWMKAVRTTIRVILGFVSSR